MRLTAPFLLTLAASLAFAESPCQSVAEWTPCEISVELSASALKAHPNPFASVEVWGEFRSPAPKLHTRRMPAFWDGGNRMVIRFTPDDGGSWTWRITGNVADAEGQQGQFTVSANEQNGFIRPANLHFWIYPETVKPHLWMATITRICSPWTAPRSTVCSRLARRRSSRICAPWCSRPALNRSPRPISRTCSFSLRWTRA
jgi:hypothetical protein